MQGQDSFASHCDLTTWYCYVCADVSFEDTVSSCLRTYCLDVQELEEMHFKVILETGLHQILAVTDHPTKLMVLRDFCTDITPLRKSDYM